MPSDRKWEGPAGPPQYNRIQDSILALRGLMDSHQESWRLPYFRRRRQRDSLRQVNEASNRFYNSVLNLYRKRNLDDPMEFIQAGLDAFGYGYLKDEAFEPYEYLWLPLVRNYEGFRALIDDYLLSVGLGDSQTANRFLDSIDESLEEIAVNNNWSLVLSQGEDDDQ